MNNHYHTSNVCKHFKKEVENNNNNKKLKNKIKKVDLRKVFKIAVNFFFFNMNLLPINLYLAGIFTQVL